MAQNGTFWEVFWAISLGPEAIPNGAFGGMGRAEVARAQPTHMPSLVSMDFRLSPAKLRPGIEGVGSPLGPCYSRVKCAIAGRGCVRHDAKPGGWERWGTLQAQLPLSGLYRSFLEIPTHTLAIRRENCSKSLTALGKKSFEEFSK
jgi:hypothetical protein